MNDQETLERNKHISDEEILTDIADTEREIREMTEEAIHLEATPMSSKDAKWNHIRASGRRSGIIDREEFVSKLKKLLALRKSQ